jgi:hypothetical protein
MIFTFLPFCPCPWGPDSYEAHRSQLQIKSSITSKPDRVSQQNFTSSYNQAWKFNTTSLFNIFPRISLKKIVFTFGGIDVAVTDVGRLALVLVDHTPILISVTHRCVHRHYFQLNQRQLRTTVKSRDDYRFLKIHSNTNWQFIWLWQMTFVEVVKVPHIFQII